MFESYKGIPIREREFSMARSGVRLVSGDTVCFDGVDALVCLSDLKPDDSAAGYMFTKGGQNLTFVLDPAGRSRGRRRLAALSDFQAGPDDVVRVILGNEAQASARIRDLAALIKKGRQTGGPATLIH